MKRLLVLLLCTSVVFLSCMDNQIGSALTSAEISMNDNPESSLEILESIDKSQLLSHRQKAEFALLYSIALDKNYVDIQSDSIIAPAVEYYKCRGDRRDRFQCYYYQARIYENCGNNESALICAANAESLGVSYIDPYSLTLLYALKGRIYHQAWRVHDAIKAYSLACEYALKAAKYRHFAFYMLLLAEEHRYNDDLIKSIECVQQAEKYISYFTLSEFHLYHRLMLLNMLESGTKPQECLKYAENYLNSYPQYHKINWLVVAQVYLKAGQPKIASEMLENYLKYQGNNNDITYNGILADVLEDMEDYSGALNAHRLFASLVKNGDVKRHLSDIKLIEERFENTVIQTRQRHLMQYIISIASTLLLIGVYFTFRWRNERRQYKRDLADLQQEYSVLCSLKEHFDMTYTYLSGQILDKTGTDQELMRVLGYRMRSLSAFLQKPIPDSLFKVASHIDDLKKSKNYIVDNIGLLYAVRYPEFVSELRSRDLTPSEIGYCCLYLLGLNIPEAGEIIGKVSSIYNVNSAIRKKLDISGTNLDKWLIKRFKEVYSEYQYESTNIKH